MTDQDPKTAEPLVRWGSEPTDQAAPVEAVGGRPGRSSRFRWAVATVVVALVATGTVAAAILLTGKAPDASVLGYVPRDSVAYVEVRLDLPGDQRANVGAFLSRFPGFADQASLESKIEEVLDRIVAEATGDTRTYTRDIAPWFGGEIGLSVGTLPDPSRADLTSARALLLVSVTDGDAFTGLLDESISEAPLRTESYGGATLTIYDIDGALFATTVADGRVGLVGDAASVRSAVDTAGTGGLDADPDFRAAVDAATDDHVAFVYLRLEAYMEWAMQLSESMPGMDPGSGLSESLRGVYPDWAAMRMRVDSDALVLDAVAPRVPDSGPSANAASVLAERVPASTIAFVEGHDVGAAIIDVVDVYRDDPSAAEAFEQIEAAAGILGGLDATIEWIGDAAIVLDRTGTGVEGGIVIVPTDGAAASRFLTTVRSFVALGGSSLGITLRDESHGDATITILDATAAAEDAGALGLGMDIPVPPPYRIAWTVTDDLVVFGSSPAFVARVLDTTAASSLASDGRYSALLARAGGSNAGVTYVDLAAIRELGEALMPGESADVYDRDVKPFLVPFDAIIQTTVVEDDLARSRTIITVR